MAMAVSIACGAPPHVALPAPQLVLLDAGAEPRQRLRYDPALHEPERMELTVKVRVGMAFTNTVLENGRKDVDAPTIKIIARFEATGATATGDTTIGCTVESAEVLDDVVDVATRRPIEPLVAKMKGLHGSWNLSPSGSVSAIAFDGPEVESGKLLPTVQELMLSSRITFPDADLGIGARWQITRQQRLGGVTWEGGETYTLRELADATATIDVDTVMHVRLAGAERRATRNDEAHLGYRHRECEPHDPAAPVGSDRQLREPRRGKPLDRQSRSADHDHAREPPGDLDAEPPRAIVSATAWFALAPAAAA